MIYIIEFYLKILFILLLILIFVVYYISKERTEFHALMFVFIGVLFKLIFPYEVEMIRNIALIVILVYLTYTLQYFNFYFIDKSHLKFNIYLIIFYFFILFPILLGYFKDLTIAILSLLTLFIYNTSFQTTHRKHLFKIIKHYENIEASIHHKRFAIIGIIVLLIFEFLTMNNIQGNFYLNAVIYSFSSFILGLILGILSDKYFKDLKNKNKVMFFLIELIIIFTIAKLFNFSVVLIFIGYLIPVFQYAKKTFYVNISSILIDIFEPLIMFFFGMMIDFSYPKIIWFSIVVFALIVAINIIIHFLTFQNDLKEQKHYVIVDFDYAFILVVLYISSVFNLPYLTIFSFLMYLYSKLLRGYFELFSN